jgi:DNA gyrase/topoisomerase IV subunit A
MTEVSARASGDIVETSLSEYGKYVAEDRALANIYDGLKPVQRRILWTAWERLKLRPGSTSKRSARVTGEATGVFHPHGDVSTYGALVTMTWQRYALICGQGNFGHPTAGMPPAAARYTGVMAPDLMPEMFKDQPVTPVTPNYSGEFDEPTVIPTRLPVLLMNGSEGIAVGVAANIPPHNLKELVQALRGVLRWQKKTGKETPTQSDFKTSERLMRWVQGPDYPEGGVLLSDETTIRNLYAQGHGTLLYRCKYRVDKVTNGYTLTVTSGCPRWTIPKFVEQCQQLVADNGLGWVENQSGEHVKVVCYARDRAKLLENAVPLLTRRIRYNWLALGKDKQIVSFNLWKYLATWLNFRREMVDLHLRLQIRVTERQLEAEDAKLKAAQDLDQTIKALRSKRPLDALQKALGINDRQAKVILKASIRTLTHRGETRQRKMVADLEQFLSQCQEGLEDIDGCILAELEDLKPYFDGRRTELGVSNGGGST